MSYTIKIWLHYGLGHEIVALSEEKINIFQQQLNVVLTLSHKTNFRLFELKQTADNYFNPFPNKPWFLRVCSTSLLKTLREKEKLLVTSNFSFSHSVFYLFGELSAIFNKLEIVVCKLFQFGRVQNLLFGKGLNWMKMTLNSIEEEKILWDKEKSLVTGNFSFSHSVSKRLVL